MLIDINAGIADELSYHLDLSLNEGLINYAQQRKSLLDKARTHGVKIPNKIPSVTIVDFTITVPVNGDTFDSLYTLYDATLPVDFVQLISFLFFAFTVTALIDGFAMLIYVTTTASEAVHPFFEVMVRV
jgi:hypothetical protein